MAKKKLNIYKVKSVPTVLEKDTIYLKEVSEDLFNIVVTDKSGTVGKVLDFVNPQQLTVELGEYAKLSDIEIYTAGEGLDLDGNEFSLTQSVLEDILKAHTHSNKSTLDGIQASDISNWDEAYSKTHVHANKSTLDSILQVDLDNWNEAHNKSHTHANKTILDGISSSDIEDWEEAYDKKVNAISFTGDTNKTLTVTREDGSILTASFLDNNDPQFPDDVLNTLTFNDNNDGVLRAITSEGSIIDVSLDGRYSLLGHKHVWEDITDRPTSLSDFTNDLGNYGNWITKAQGDTYYSAIGHTHTFASLTSKPTTIGGYGITDFNSLGDARWALRTRTITGTGSLTGGGNLTANRTLDLTATTKDNIAKGVTAHGWGNHASAGYATETYVEDAIDDIEIGGRNLLLNSNFQRGFNYYWERLNSSPPSNFEIVGTSLKATFVEGSNTHFGRRNFVSENNLNLSESVVFSALIKGEGSFKIRFGTITKPIINIENNTYKKYVQVIPKSDYGNGNLIIEVLSGELYFDRLKIEKGNKPTDWTPAPEDQVTDWNETNPDSYSFIKNKPKIPSITGLVPYTGANQPIDLNTQDFTTGGYTNRLHSYFERINLASDSTSAYLNFKLLTNVAAAEIGNASSQTSDIIITLPITTSTQWQAEIDILRQGYRTTLNIGGYSVNNTSRFVNGVHGDISDIIEVKFGRIGQSTVLIIKRSDPTIHRLQVNISKFYYHHTNSFGLYDDKTKYKVEYIDESELIGFTLNGVVKNSEFTRDSHYLDYNNFTNTPTIPTVNNGELTLSTGTGLTGSATFTANQSGSSSFSVSVASTHKLPTTAEWNDKVNKVGDTMTGKLTITSNTYQDHLELVRGNIKFGIMPSTGSSGELRFLATNATRYLFDKVIEAPGMTIGGNEVWHSDNLTNVSQLTNDAGYITSVPDSFVTKNNINSSALATTVIDFDASGNGASILYAGASSTNVPSVSGTAGGLLMRGNHSTVGEYQLYLARGENDALLYRNQSGVWNRAASREWTNSQGFLTSVDLSGYATETWVKSFGIGKPISQYNNISTIERGIPGGLYSTNTSTEGGPIPGSSGSLISIGAGVSSGGTNSFMWLMGNNANAPRAFFTHANTSGEMRPWEEIASHSWVNSQNFSTQTLSSSTSNIISGSTVQRAALTGDVTAAQNSNATTIVNNAVTTAKIANSAVTHAKYQNIATQRILGRGATGTGNVQELTLGSNLSLSTSGVLSATNTTYSAGTLAQLNAGTNTTNRVWGAKTIADYVKQYTGDNLGLQGVTDIGNWTTNNIEVRLLNTSSANDLILMPAGSSSNPAGNAPLISTGDKGFRISALRSPYLGTMADAIETRMGMYYPDISNTGRSAVAFSLGDGVSWGYSYMYNTDGSIGNGTKAMTIELDYTEHHTERWNLNPNSQELQFPPESGTLATREWVMGSGDDPTTTIPPTLQPSLGLIFQDTYRNFSFGDNIDIDRPNRLIHAIDTKYTAGSNVSISSSNVISATNTTYSAGSLAQLIAGTQTANRVWSAKNLSDYVESKTEPNQVVITSSLTTNAGHNGSTIVFNGNSAALTVNGTMGAGAELYLINNTGGNRTISSSMISFSLRENGTTTTKSSLQLKPFGVATLVRLSSGTMFMCYGDLI